MPDRVTCLDFLLVLQVPSLLCHLDSLASQSCPPHPWDQADLSSLDYISKKPMSFPDQGMKCTLTMCAVLPWWTWDARVTSVPLVSLSTLWSGCSRYSISALGTCRAGFSRYSSWTRNSNLSMITKLAF